jgi:hypothetical protein
MPQIEIQSPSIGEHFNGRWAGAWVVKWKSVGDGLKPEPRKAIIEGGDVGYVCKTVLIVIGVNERYLKSGVAEKLR